jgi:NADPH-dependent ferric siderophore reductase
MISSMPKWVGDLFSKALRPNMKIISVEYLSPQIKRIRFHGDISNMNFEFGQANVIRVTETEYRNYTVAYHNNQEGILDIIFHIHGNGPGSGYGDSLKAGDEIFISGPRGKKFYDARAAKQFVFGDETSLGLAYSFLPILEQGRHEFQFYFELEEENKDIPYLLGLKKYTVFSKNGSFHNEKWISELPLLQAGDWLDANFVLTGNARSVQAFRRVLKNCNASKVASQGYWLEGKSGL